MKDKHLDKILKKLGDFDPQAKPNWDAFIAENESQINNNGKISENEAGKNIVPNKTLRYAGVAATAVVALFIAWYFTGIPFDTSAPQNLPEQQDVEVVGDRQNNVPESIEKIDVREIENTQPEVEIQPNIQEDAKSLKTQIIEPAETNNTNLPDVFDNEQAVEPSSPKTVIIKDTVFMKKTIYVTDTVKRK